MSHKQAKRMRAHLNNLVRGEKQPKKHGPEWREDILWRLWIAQYGEPRT